ncbi:TPA: hypothetical protein ACIPUI_000060 [Citrobacter freundii]
MESNSQLIYKLSPLFIRNDVIFLAGYDGELFEYHPDTGRLSMGQSDFIYCTDLFTLIQNPMETGWGCILIYSGNEFSFPIDNLIEEISIIYHLDGYEIVLHTEEGWQSIRIISSDIQISEHYPHSVRKPLERGTLQLPHGQLIDLYGISCVTAVTGEELKFDSILSISAAGLLFSRETNEGNTLYLASIVHPGVDHLEDIPVNVCAACYDGSTAQFYLTTVTAGQQQIALFGKSGFTQPVSRDGYYGTITPLIADEGVALFITGSKEGVRIDYPEQNSSRQILPGLSTRKRIFYEAPLLKVTSLMNPVQEKTNILFSTEARSPVNGIHPACLVF